MGVRDAIATDNALCYCYGNYTTHATDETSKLVMGDMAFETKRVSSQLLPL
jgi:hypothetical protein